MDDLNLKYHSLILRKFEEEISPQEKAELDSWLREPENRIFYEEQEKLWQSADDYRRMRTVNKKEALRKIENHLFKKTPWSLIKKAERIAAILFLPVLLTGIWLFSNPLPVLKKQVAYHTVQVPLGMTSSIVLPDGTKVALNAGSSLKYPVTFDKKGRNVQLSGEAYFEVKKNKHKPFTVTASDITIQVTGTSFNCSAYPEDRRIETALVEGEIRISAVNRDAQGLSVKPGELAVFSKAENTIEKRSTDLDKYISWKSGKLIFRDDSMATVLMKLGRRYNVEFQVIDKEMLGYEYSATFSGESLDQVLKLLSLSAPIYCEMVPRKILKDYNDEKQIIKLHKQ
jgi:ferric-dicitrate binding protein FerR (iron transport regulator)